MEEDASFFWIPGRCKLFRNFLWPPKRQDFTPCPRCWGRKTEQQRATSLSLHYFLFMPENTVSFFLNTPLLTLLSIFNDPFCSENVRRSFHHSSSVPLTSLLVKSLNVSASSFNLGINFVFFQTLRVSFQGWHTEDHLGPGCTHTKPQRCCPLLRWGLPSCQYLETQACGAGCSLCLCCQAASRGWSSLQWKEGKVGLQSKFKLFKANTNPFLEGGPCITCTPYILEAYLFRTQNVCKNVWCWIPHTVTAGVSVCTDPEVVFKRYTPKNLFSKNHRIVWVGRDAEDHIGLW